MEAARLSLRKDSGMSDKKIEVCTMRVGDLKHDFGNPRKISKKNREELERSLDQLGDFGLIVIDDENNVICGNQRTAIMQKLNPDAEVTCKRLTGYTTAELRAINIKDNTHAGEWDFDLLANWTADLNIDLGLKDDLQKEAKHREIEEMELLPFEKYNYVIIACRTALDYDILTEKLGIKDKKVLLGGKRAIAARGVWYDDVEDVLFKGGSK